MAIKWINYDKLDASAKLASDTPADLTKVMAGNDGADRVAKYSANMAAGMAFNYAAKNVDDTILKDLQKLADEAQLAEKFEALYNGEVINTGEKRLVLHHLTRGQLGNKVECEGTDKRAALMGPRVVYVNDGTDWVKIGSFEYPDLGTVRVRVNLDEPMKVTAIGTIADCKLPNTFFFRQIASDFATTD